jgi:hypothetical protein
MAKLEKGILSRKAEKKIGGTYLDDLISAGIFEVFDGTAFTFAIRTIDDRFGSLIPEPHQTKLRDLIDTVVVEEKYDESIDEACAYLDIVIDLPFIEDEAEADVFNGLAMLIKGVFKTIRKKK